MYLSFVMMAQVLNMEASRWEREYQMVEKRMREIMSEDFLTTAKSQTLPEAIKMLCSARGKRVVPRAIVVFDQNQSFWGLLTLECVLESVRPSFMKSSNQRGVVTWNGILLESCQKLAGLKVEDVADKEVPRLEPEDRLIKVIHLFLKTNRRELPVLEDDTVVGLVDVGRIIQEINELITKFC